jgi:hypothetical protein
MPITVRGTAHPYKQYTFRISQQTASYLKKTKIDVLALSNNHTMDYGAQGLFDTIAFLREWALPIPERVSVCARPGTGGAALRRNAGDFSVILRSDSP